MQDHSGGVLIVFFACFRCIIACFCHFQKEFGLDDFRPGQLEAIYALLEEKKTTFAILPTGAGKSLIYLFNRVMTKKTVLVFEPTLALMHDQKRAIEKFRRSFNVVLVIKGETPANAMADAKAGKIDFCK
jgi:superfamily II DNA helicase RecQ